MHNEIEALYKYRTWDITNWPKNRKPVGCKWVYKIKYKPNREVEQYKARLVAMGYNHSKGIDYQETFTPFAKIMIVCLVISMSFNNLSLFINWI